MSASDSESNISVNSRVRDTSDSTLSQTSSNAASVDGAKARKKAIIKKIFQKPLLAKMSKGRCMYQPTLMHYVRQKCTKMNHNDSDVNEEVLQDHQSNVENLAKLEVDHFPLNCKRRTYELKMEREARREIIRRRWEKAREKKRQAKLAKKVRFLIGIIELKLGITNCDR